MIVYSLGLACFCKNEPNITFTSSNLEISTNQSRTYSQLFLLFAGWPSLSSLAMMETWTNKPKPMDSSVLRAKMGSKFTWDYNNCK